MHCIVSSPHSSFSFMFHQSDIFLLETLNISSWAWISAYYLVLVALCYTLKSRIYSSWSYEKLNIDYFFIAVIQTLRAFEFMGSVHNWKHRIQSFQLSGVYHFCINHINPLMNFSKFILKIPHKSYELKQVTSHGFGFICIYFTGSQCLCY